MTHEYSRCILQSLFASYLLAPALAAARADLRQRFGQAVATLHAGHGRGPDRSRLDATRGVALPRAAVAAACGGVSQPWWRETARGRGRRRRRAPARPALRASPRFRGLLLRCVSSWKECSQEPEVLTSSVPTSVSRLWQQSNARKGAVNKASLEHVVKSEMV